MKNKKGFTLVEIIATIAILSIIVLISAPSVIKSFNKSRIQAMVIQENKLIETGDVLLDDYCKDAIDDSYKKQCEIYYQELVLSNEDREANKDVLNKNKIYKYICVNDMKKLHYYTEDLEFSGTPCQGVVVYEIDYYTNRQTDAYSYVKCEDAYRTQDRNVKIENLFQNCFDEYSSDENYNKTYTVTIKHVENDLGGMEIKPRETKVLKSEDYNKSTIFSIKTIPHERNGNTYYSALNKGGKNIDYDDTRKENGLKIFDIKSLPKENLTISIVYSVEKHNVITNYYRYSPGGFVKNHNNEKMNSKDPTTLNGFTYETVTVDAPKTITDKVDGKDELFNLAYAYIDDEPMSLPFNSNVDIGKVDKNVELVYQRDEFDLTYNNKGGTGCSNTRIKFNREYGTLCKPTRKGYTFKGWSLTDGGKKINATDINEDYHDLTLYALWEAKTYTITYHIGNASDTAGSSIIKTKTCTFDKTCTLDTFSSLNVVFPYSREYKNLDSDNNPNYGWQFAGWTNYETTMDIKYSDGYSFKYNKDYNLDLYAIGERELHINGGVNPTSTLYHLPQMWNPYSTSDEYLTEVTLPAGKEISGWTFIGYKPGNSLAVGSVKFDTDDIGVPFKAKYNVWPFIRSAYKRDVTIVYNANGGSGTTASQTKVQYYNSGFASGGVNHEAKVSIPEFNLATNKFTKTGNTFQKWMEGSIGGTEYSEGSAYEFAPEVTDSTTTKTFYAKWDSNTYTITYHLGNATSTVGTTSIGTTSCKYGEICNLESFDSLGKVFPYSYQDEQSTKDTTKHGNYGWSFAGWSTSKSDLTTEYSNAQSFTYNTAGNINLYAIGKRNLHINGGIAPTKSYSEPIQYWNPYGTSDTYVTEVSLPTAQTISGWTFLGFKCGDSTANSSVTLSSSLAGTNYKVPYNKFPYTRSVYQRTLTVAYNANTGSGTTSNQTNTQYYNSGYGSDGTNKGANVTQVDFSLRTNAFTKSGYEFSKWAEGSATGTKYSSGSTYSMKPAVNSTATTKTMYAIWEPKTYTITYYLGNASSTVGGTSIGTSTCKYNTSCTLTGFDSLSKVFPYSYEDETKNSKDNYGWSFAGWSTASNDLTTEYSNAQTFTYNTVGNVSLYAIGKRNLHINGGIAPTSSYSELLQYWNPYGLSGNYLSEVTLPSEKTISGWTFLGYRAGSSAANSTVTFASSLTGKSHEAPYNTWPYIRSMYSRTITIDYNENGGINVTDSHTDTQYYNSGYGKDSSNNGAKVSNESITLANNGFTRYGYNFVSWTEGSTSGTEYDQGGTYVFKNGVSSAASKTFYAKWDPVKSILTFNPNGGSVSQANKTVVYMQKYGEFPTPTRTGYDFVGWYFLGSVASRDDTKKYKDYPWLYYADHNSDLYDAFGYDQEKLKNHYNDYGKSENRRISERTSNDVNTTPSDQIIYAGWYPKTYTITYNLNGGTNPSGTKTTYNIQTSYTLPTPTKSGSVFDGWYTESSFTTKVTSISPGTTGNKTFYAKWKTGLIIASYKCANVTVGSSPYDMEYGGNCTFINDGNGNWRVKLLSTGSNTITFNGSGQIDVFLVGGGGGGAGADDVVGGPGGAGGRTTTVTKTITANTNYTITIGEGGTGGGKKTAGGTGGTTTAFNTSVAGGAGGGATYNSNLGYGGSGGSGGGSGGTCYYKAGDGGSYGSTAGACSYSASSSQGDGRSSTCGSRAGSGQNSTTCEFGEGTTTSCTNGTSFAYAGGGGGGAARCAAQSDTGQGGSSHWWGRGSGGIGGGGRGAGTATIGATSGIESPIAGTANTGGGGGGGYAQYMGGKSGAAGGSGVVVIRNKR